MGTFDITLPVRKKPVFPSQCVVCEKPDPNSTMELSLLGANTGSVAADAVDVVLDIDAGSPAGNNTTTDISGIPVCSGCESRLKWYHRLLKFATYTIWLPALAIMLLMPGPMWIRVVIFIAIIIAPPILSMIFPPEFGATILNGKATFEFKSKRIADEFAKLNDAVPAVSEAVQTSAA